MTIKDKILLELLNEFNGPIDSIRKSTTEIIDLTSDLIHVFFDAKIQFPPWKIYIETLVHKIIFNSYSIVNLSQGYTFQFKNVKGEVIDYSSILVLTRTLIENYLTLFYIYFEEKTEAEKNFRFKLWEISGLITRQGYDFSSRNNNVYEEFKIKKQKEKAVLEKLLSELQKLPEFNNLNKNELNKLKKYGLPRIDNWHKLIEKSNLKMDLFNVMYSLSSNYAHSEFVSLMQIKQSSFSSKNNNTISLASLCLILTKIINSLVIEYLIQNYKSVEIIYNAKPFSIQKSIEICIKLGKKTSP